MRNTNAIIDSICKNTTFHPAIKAGLRSLSESNVDIIYWNTLNEAEENAVTSAFNKFSSAVTGDLTQGKPAPSSETWIQQNKAGLEEFIKGKKTEQEGATQKHLDDQKRWAYNPFRNVEVTDREQAIADDAKTARATQDNYADIISKTEQTVGVQNIKNYLEKISSDVQTFVKLVTLLTDQIVKEAWVKAPETIASVFGKKLYFLEAPALAIRNQNIDAFLAECAITLELAEDVSLYFVLQNANNDIKKSIEEIWDNVEKKSQEKVKKADVPEPVKSALLLQENFTSMFTNAVWDIIPKLIERHGNDFFLIIESDGGITPTAPTPTSTTPKNVKTLFDAFNSSRFQAYNPIFETMYQELAVKKPFNWLLELEEKLVDDLEIEKNLSYCGSTMVQQGLATKNDFTLPTIGKIAGTTAHKLVQMSYKSEDGLSKLLKVKEALWITSSFVPGTYGLILLLLNVSCGVMFVAYAEDIVGFDISKVYPKFTKLPIWSVFREGVLDLKQEYANKDIAPSDNKSEKPEVETTSAKTGIKFN